MTKYSVLIIGAGNIGAFYDKPSNKAVLTHAHAFTKHKGFKLLGFVDKNKEKALQAAKIWGGEPFLGIKEAFCKCSPDIAVVSVPDEGHYKVLKQISVYRPRMVVVEKPITTEISQAKSVINIYKKKKIGILVNYTRRFDPVIEQTALNIRNREYGEYLTGAACYGKGVLHNGSHIIDLLRYLFGGIKNFELLDKIYDYTKKDPSASCVLELNNRKKFYLSAVDSRQYSLFEMDLFFEKKRVRFVDSAFKVENYDVAKNGLFKGHKMLSKGVVSPTKSSKSMYFLACNVYNHLAGGEAIKCTANDGYEALLICRKILKKTK